MKKDFLSELTALSRQRAGRLATDLDKFRALIEQSVAPPALRLSADGFDLIAEYKRRSPTLGELARPTGDLGRQLSAYAKGGAAMISVLTETAHFDGSLLHLSAAARLMKQADIPVMRKDFLVNPLQLYEARAAGGVLLIIRILDDPALEKMLDCAAELGLFVLAEAFDRTDLTRLAEVSVARENQQILAGVNCRDLSTLELKPERFFELAPLLPPGLPAVAESGIGDSEDLPSLADAGYRLALIGGALMRHARPADFLSACLAGVRNRAARMAGGD